MIAVGFWKGGESCSAASLPLPGSLPPWKNSLLHLRRPFLHHADLRGYHLKAMFSSSVWTAVFCGPSPPPYPAPPHSSSGFAILFSAVSCTKLCCDCAVGLDMAKRIQRSPFSSYQTTLQSSLHPVPFSPFVFNFKVSVLQGGWMQDRYYIKLYCYLRCNKACQPPAHPD